MFVQHSHNIANWQRSHNSYLILDEATRKQLERGQRITEVMKQKQYMPLSVAEMATILFAADQGYLDDVPLNRIAMFEQELIATYMLIMLILWNALIKPVITMMKSSKTLRTILESFKANQAWD